MCHRPRRWPQGGGCRVCRSGHPLRVRFLVRAEENKALAHLLHNLQTAVALQGTAAASCRGVIDQLQRYKIFILIMSSDEDVGPQSLDGVTLASQRFSDCLKSTYYQLTM
ncbi:hypothetical protein GOP47_0015312 [Adiantum capillus-veneris]|uniref:Uncharacterized protein n=1 Tax=Adiantum capillus-veneris TaxID=13818 RepID=A0A9D4ZDW3_ADICA|nr:hypothetical protein GOP47_0015312 [Adiantum capillus-veneris]